ncbi:structural protein [Tenacibaculum phage Larrie]|nr:structural protein [Tenacibaculum phage Larrie]
MAQQFNVGKAPVGILTRALTGNIFIQKSLAYMNEGDKDGYTAYKHDVQNVLRARTSNPAAQANASTLKKEAYKRSLAELESFEEFDPKDYHSYWLEFQPSGVFQWESLPDNVQRSLEELFLGTAAEAVEDILTNGSPEVTGLIPQLRSNVLTSLNGAKATPTQITANTHIAFRAHAGGTGENQAEVLTADNVFDKLELLISKQTSAMRKRTGRKFMVNHATGDLIRTAQRLKLNFKGVDVTEEGVMRYGGFDIIENPSFPDNDIMLASMTGDFRTDAIQLGTSSSADYNNVTVDRDSKFSRVWGMCLTLALDIFLVRPEEVCYYTAETIA